MSQTHFYYNVNVSQYFILNIWVAVIIIEAQMKTANVNDESFHENLLFFVIEAFLQT